MRPATAAAVTPAAAFTAAKDTRSSGVLPEALLDALAATKVEVDEIGGMVVLDVEFDWRVKLGACCADSSGANAARSAGDEAIKGATDAVGSSNGGGPAETAALWPEALGAGTDDGPAAQVASFEAAAAAAATAADDASV